MHHTIEIAVPAKAAEGVLAELEVLEGVAHLSVVCGASVKPPGDVVTVHVVNRETSTLYWRWQRRPDSPGRCRGAPPRPKHHRRAHATRAIDDDVDESP